MRLSHEVLREPTLARSVNADKSVNELSESQFKMEFGLEPGCRDRIRGKIPFTSPLRWAMPPHLLPGVIHQRALNIHRFLADASYSREIGS
jgi:hypothetical protein